MSLIYQRSDKDMALHIDGPVQVALVARADHTREPGFHAFGAKAAHPSGAAGQAHQSLVRLRLGRIAQLPDARRHRQQVRQPLPQGLCECVECHPRSSRVRSDESSRSKSIPQQPTHGEAA